jgi:hypothetical protein
MPSRTPAFGDSAVPLLQLGFLVDANGVITIVAESLGEFAAVATSISCGSTLPFSGLPVPIAVANVIGPPGA